MMNTSIKRLPLRTVFDTGKLGWKLDENGAIVVKDGNPVWINDKGEEGTVGVATLGQMSAENKAFRLRAENAEKALKPFEGLDPAAAKSALETVAALGDGGVVEAAKLDQIKAQMQQTYEGQIADVSGKLQTVTERLNNTVLSAAFGNSKFIEQSIAIPKDMFQAAFAKHFKVEEGNIVAVDAKGEPLMSKTRFGENADFEEAVAILVDGYANKDQILKAPSGGGTGSGGGGGKRPGDRVVRRSDFNQLPPAEQAAIAAKARSGEVQIVSD